MFKQILTTVCVAAIMSTGSVAYSQSVGTGSNVDSDGNTTTITAPATQDNDQSQGSLSNQSNVGNGSNSNSSNNTTIGDGSTSTSTSTDNSHYDTSNVSTSTNIQNQNGYVASVPIIASAGTCLGSVGGTISAAGIGIGSSKTIVDEECNKRQQQQLDSNVKAQEAVTRANTVRLLNELGLQPAALSLLCQDPSTRLALKAGLEPVVYNKVCKVYEPSIENLAIIQNTSEY